MPSSMDRLLYGTEGISHDVFQVTPIGMQRVQSGKKPAALSHGGYDLLRKIVEVGGVMDKDEMRIEGMVPYGYGRYGVQKKINKLVDLGFLQPVGGSGVVESPSEMQNTL